MALISEIHPGAALLLGPRGSLLRLISGGTRVAESYWPPPRSKAYDRSSKLMRRSNIAHRSDRTFQPCEKQLVTNGQNDSADEKPDNA